MNLSKENQIENLRLIRRKEVQAKTGLGASSIYALMSEGRFPKPVTLSIRRVAWVESEVDAWIAERVAKHRANIATMEA